VSPTRFLIHDKVYDEFVSTFTEQVKAIRVGNGLEDVDMGPMANARRVQAMETLVADATSHGGTIATGGRRIGNAGHFFEPTVLQNVPVEARIMNEEPFGPVIIANRFNDIGAAIEESNRLPYGLAAYAYTRSSKNIDMLSESFESGMVSVNQQGLALPETPFGGVKDSGFGSEGGSEALEPFLNTKFVSQIGI
jgi:succinate-semialdehyde dehydrogenase/glutarate-semialdehyde dehydrogenase